MNYKSFTDFGIKTTLIEFQTEEIAFTNSYLETAPLEVNSLLAKLNYCNDNSDYSTFLAVIDNFTEKLNDEKYVQPINYKPGSVSNLIKNFLNPVQHPELLHSVIPFIQKWTSFQNVENDDFVFPDFFNYIISIINNNEDLDPSYENVEQYHMMFYDILNNLLATSQNMREMFISQNPLCVFTEIYKSSNYYQIAYEKSEIDKMIMLIIINSLRDYNYSNQLSKDSEFFNHLLIFFDVCLYRFAYCFLNTAKYEFDLLRTLFQTNEEFIIKFFKNFDTYEYFKNLKFLSNERFFPFLKILMSIIKNYNYFSDEVSRFIKINIIDSIDIESVILYFRNHEELEESYLYVKFLNTYFERNHDNLILLVDNHINEVLRYEKFISDGYYKLKKEALKLFDLIFKIDSDFYVQRVLKELESKKIELGYGEDFFNIILDMFEYDDDFITYKILQILDKILECCLKHDTITEYGVEIFVEKEIKKIIDDLKYESDRDEDFINLCDSVMTQIDAIVDKKAEKDKKIEVVDPFADLFNDPSIQPNEDDEYTDYYSE